MRLFSERDLAYVMDNEKIREKTIILFTYVASMIVSLFMTIFNIVTGEIFTMYFTLTYCFLNLLNLVLIKNSNRYLNKLRLVYTVESLLLISFFVIYGGPDGFSATWALFLPFLLMFIYDSKRASIASVVQFAILIILFQTEVGIGLLGYRYSFTFMDRFPIVYLACFIAALINKVILEIEISECKNALRRRERRISERAKAIQKNEERRENMYLGIADMLNEIIDGGDGVTGGHVKRVADITRELGYLVQVIEPKYNLTSETINMISEAASLHDVGKILVPKEILNKPGELTDEEMKEMRNHSVYGSNLLETAKDVWERPFYECCYNICRYHHERYDGSGYPDGLYGEEIPIEAQIVGVADCLDGLMSKRQSKEGKSKEEAMNMIINGECGYFSPIIIEALARLKMESITENVGTTQSVFIESDR